MSLPAGEEKEIRMQASSLGYNNNTNNLENPITIAPENARTGFNHFSGGSKSTNPRISYRECHKNHAANLGGTVTDGCGEFMPSGEDALKCAACSCHRNFHRKENHGGDPHAPASAATVHPLQIPPPLPSPSLSQHRGGAAHWSPMVHPVKMAFGGGGGGSAGTDSSSEELNFNAYHSNNTTVAPPPPQFVNKKRFRTKFTAEQKEKMLELAEKLGWRIPREDDTEVQRFCAESGVKRQVFKVWMHNNKSSSSKKPPQDDHQI